MMPAHVARFAPDATAQGGVSCLGYKAHFSEAVAAMQGKKMNVVAGKASRTG
jgi:hypothetical protein